MSGYVMMNASAAAGSRSPGVTACYLLATTGCAAVTAAAMPMRGILDEVSVVMLFVLVVFGAALYLGRGPAVVAAFLALPLYDFFFVPPRFTFALDDLNAIITFGILLAVGLVTAELVSRVRGQIIVAADLEREGQRLHDVACRLAGAMSAEHVRAALEAYLAPKACRVALHLLGARGAIAGMESDLAASKLARTAMDLDEPLDASSLGEPDGPQALVPLRGPTRKLGVLALLTQRDRRLDLAKEKDRLLAVASLAAIALESLASRG